MQSSAPAPLPLSILVSGSNALGQEDETYIDQVLNGSRRSMQHIVHMLDADILAARRDMRQQMRQHCGAFLDGAVAVSSGRARLRSLGDSATSIASSCDSALHLIRQTVAASQVILQRRKTSAIAMARIADIVCTLEAPLLATQCADAENFDGALMALDFARRVAASAAPDSAVASAIGLQADAALRNTSLRLVQVLSSPLSIPAALPASAALRRLCGGASSDAAAVTAIFLRCRLTWLENAARELDSLPPHARCLKACELVRCTVFECAVQCSNSFADADADSSAQPTLAPTSSQQLLSSFMLAAVQLLLRVLYSASANMSDGEELWHVLDSALYSSTQMSRYGCDFAALLPPIARKWALRSMSSACDRAVAALRQPWPPSPPSTSSRSFKSQLSLEIPPLAALPYPLMATFTNTIVSCINNVRECLSHCAKAPCSRLLDSALEAALPLISSQGDGMAAVAYELEVRPWIALVSQNVFGVKSKFAPAVTAPVLGVHAVVANGTAPPDAPPAPSHSNSVADAADVSNPSAADAIAAAPAADADASTVNAAALSNGGS
jgi:hypothetical protein